MWIRVVMAAYGFCHHLASVSEVCELRTNPALLQTTSGPKAPQCGVTVRRVGALVVTNARVYHHHGSLQQSAGGAAEGHLGGGGLRRRTAAGVGALSAVAQLVGTGAVAALVDEPNGAWRRVDGPAPPPLSPLENSGHMQAHTTGR